MSEDNLTRSEAREIERIKKMELPQDNKSLSDEIDEGLEILSVIAALLICGVPLLLIFIVSVLMSMIL
ncbi:TPA: transcriptional regulator [Streptococcus agalactiae]|nr:transcriptional regulator [Streptococcus agalactiae]HEM9551159.1 transcriptional regulator [Streptococcus agalactiae]HEM9553140.1 transcriptional regulator [Streptococcus agalactiae]HEM9567068.1 transcriptional regulator [Streptococcus agalactiae]HEM9606100.1 transcriptional regulator [Streptococcus agalactiae]